MKDDTISRQAVLEGLVSIAKAKAKSDAQKSMMGRTMFFVEQLSPVNVAEKMGRWIPVSERLPELLEDVLICDSGGCINIGFCVKRKYASGKEYTSWVEVGSDLDATPIAWMPLPQPYKGESEE